MQNERVPSLTVLILLISVGRGDLLGAHQYLVVRVDQSNTTHTSRIHAVTIKILFIRHTWQISIVKRPHQRTHVDHLHASAYGKPAEKSHVYGNPPIFLFQAFKMPTSHVIIKLMLSSSPFFNNYLFFSPIILNKRQNKKKDTTKVA